MIEVGKRLKQVRQELCINQKQLSESLAVGQGTVSKLELGIQALDVDHIHALYEHYNINPMYLILGHEPMIINDEISNLTQIKVHLKHIKHHVTSIEASIS